MIRATPQSPSFISESHVLSSVHYLVIILLSSCYHLVIILLLSIFIWKSILKERSLRALWGIFLSSCYHVVIIYLYLLLSIFTGKSIFNDPFHVQSIPRTPGCSPGCSKSDPRPSPPEIACYASAMRLLCVCYASLPFPLACDLGLWVSLFGSRIAEGTPSESIMNG